MLSRVAENLYWLGRDLERVENIARMAEVSHAVAIEAGGAEGGEQQAWDAVLAATGSLALYAEAHAEDPFLSPPRTWLQLPRTSKRPAPSPSTPRPATIASASSPLPPLPPPPVRVTALPASFVHPWRDASPP